MTTTPRDMTRWLEDAHHALDSGAALTVDHLLALASQPERLIKGARATWWSEELARVMKQKIGDAYPGSHATNDDVRAWNARQEFYEMQIDSLADAHAAAIAAAGKAQKSKDKKARRSFADLALDATDDANGSAV